MPFVWIYIDIDIYISLSVNKTDVYVCYCTQYISTILKLAKIPSITLPLLQLIVLYALFMLWCVVIYYSCYLLWFAILYFELIFLCLFSTVSYYSTFFCQIHLTVKFQIQQVVSLFFLLCSSKDSKSLKGIWIGLYLCPKSKMESTAPLYILQVILTLCVASFHHISW